MRNLNARLDRLERDRGRPDPDDPLDKPLDLSGATPGELARLAFCDAVIDRLGELAPTSREEWSDPSRAAAGKAVAMAKSRYTAIVAGVGHRAAAQPEPDDDPAELATCDALRRCAADGEFMCLVVVAVRAGVAELRDAPPQVQAAARTLAVAGDDVGIGGVNFNDLEQAAAVELMSWLAGAPGNQWGIYIGDVRGA